METQPLASYPDLAGFMGLAMSMYCYIYIPIFPRRSVVRWFVFEMRGFSWAPQAVGGCVISSTVCGDGEDQVAPVHAVQADDKKPPVMDNITLGFSGNVHFCGYLAEIYPILGVSRAFVSCRGFCCM